ncbi:MAG: biotin--[acetyl-CoA-carboxylase] ligase [Deltaproteobacteria bacterium]|nr:MAG: biotin--[acetyl-CoA-carboxylase] ligase [Deltaproteobacteria bacterium]
MSCVLRPAVPPAEAPRLSLVASLAVSRALEQLGFEPGIKWPNDVFLAGRKVCGILTEIEAEADAVRFVVVGIGVNVNAEERDFPPELRQTATSLRLASGRTWDRARVAGLLLGGLDEWYRRFLTAPFRVVTADWNRRSILTGKRVRVDAPGGAVEGVCLGIDADGALLLDGGRGTRRVIAGDATVVGGVEP